VSQLSLLSSVKHSTIWERRWFQIVVAGRGFAGERPEDENAFRLTGGAVETVVSSTANKSLPLRRSFKRLTSTHGAHGQR
jgi:hypothetical protein